MYNHVIDIDDELWDIIEYGVNFKVDTKDIALDRKSLTMAHKKLHRKHHRVRGILVEALL